MRSNVNRRFTIADARIKLERLYPSVVVTDIVMKPYADADWGGLPAQELAPHGITVNAICPSLTPTERVGHMTNLFDNPELQVKEATDALLSGAAGSTPVGRLAQTEDLAHAVSFLASDGAAFLTGLSVPVTGGSFIR